MTWIWIILCFLFAYICFVYWYKKNRKSYLAESGIPMDDGGTFAMIGLALKSRFGKGINLHELQIEKYKKYGRLYGTSVNGKQIVVISDLDLVKKILVKDFHAFSSRRALESGNSVHDNFLTLLRGEKWKRIRTIVTPAFSTGKIKRTTDIIVSCAKTLTENFLTEAGKPIDGKKFFSTFTMDVIASTAFGTKIYSYADPNNRFVQEANKAFNKKINFKIAFVALLPKLARLLGVAFYDKTMIQFFTDATLEIIEDRKKNGTVKNDFLQLLIDAEKEQQKEENLASETIPNTAEDANDLGHEDGNEKLFKYTKRYKSLSHNELVAQCLVFFLAGFDTTASALTCAAYELAVNPEMQEKLRKEIDAAISKHDNKLTYEAIAEMKYLDCFLTETLRLYPPAAGLERLTEEDYELEGTGLTLKKGTSVVIPVAAIHQDAEYYPEPNVFRPERFEPDEKALRHPYAFLPFGAGPRNCIAMRFALMELKLCIAYILSQLIIKRCPETKVPLTLNSPLGLLKPHAIFTVGKRTNTVLNDNY